MAKEARKNARVAARADREPVDEGVDPDIAGLKPGPQPIVEDDW
jgi:hypothetical protein